MYPCVRPEKDVFMSFLYLKLMASVLRRKFPFELKSYDFPRDFIFMFTSRLCVSEVRMNFRLETYYVPFKNGSRGYSA